MLPKLLELTHAHCAAPLAEVHKVYMALVAIKDEMGDEDNVEKCREKCRAHSFKVGDAGVELLKSAVRLLPGPFFGGLVRLLLCGGGESDPALLLLAQPPHVLLHTGKHAQALRAQCRHR